MQNISAENLQKIIALQAEEDLNRAWVAEQFEKRGLDPNSGLYSPLIYTIARYYRCLDRLRLAK